MAGQQVRTRARYAVNPVILAVLVGMALAAGFLGGYSYSRWTPAAAPANRPAVGGDGPATPDSHFALLSEVQGIIEREYYRPADLDQQKLVHGAARGMVQAIGDPHAVFEAPRERQTNDSRWTGRYEGVGIYVDFRDGRLVVTAPIEGSPAQKAGIRTGDVLLEVDGRSVAGLNLTDQTLLIRGPRGTTVTLTVRREGVATPLRLAIVREEIRLISARGRILDNGLGVLRITQFTEATLHEATTALDALLATSPSGLILDLRGNPGGLLEPAVKVAGLFLGGGPVVHEVHANGEVKTYEAPNQPPRTDLPLTVLIDRGSASASEVLAAALRDRGRAELLGERTYGKSTVQYIHPLSDGSGLRITVAEWHTPSSQPIPSSGLEPDWPVPAAANAPDGRDPVLEVAGQRLLARIANPIQ